jgi:hypothetical protein
MKYLSKSVRAAILTGSIWSAAAMSTRAAIVMQQNFDTDPVNYTASPFVQQGTGLDATSKYWDLSNNVPVTIRNPNLVGNTTNYLTGQNMDAPLPFATGTPAQVDFAVPVPATIGTLTLSLDLAGLPSAEVENYVRAFTTMTAMAFTRLRSSTSSEATIALISMRGQGRH